MSSRHQEVGNGGAGTLESLRNGGMIENIGRIHFGLGDCSVDKQGGRVVGLLMLGCLLPLSTTDGQ